MSGNPRYTAFTLVSLVQMETQLQQIQDNTLAGGPLWGDAIQLDYFAVSSALRQIEADIKAREDNLIEADIKTRE